MVCLGLEPRAVKWKVQTNPLSYGAPQTYIVCHLQKFDFEISLENFSN